jgi:hypothetical protein
MNKYKCFYNKRSIEIDAFTTLEAQNKAAAQFKARKSWQVTVMLLCLSDGKEVIHKAVD